jgi:hypothetical protein
VAYKEFQNFKQNAPTGYLAADQRHKVRGWLTYDLGTRVGHFNLGLIERYDSGSPYSAAASITINSVAGLTATTYPDGTPRVSTHDYANIPTAVTYFFSKRGQFTTDAIVATDLALNYELPIHNFAFFAKAEVRNAFNHKATVGVVTTVLTNQNSSANLAAFNPFTQTPVQCTAATVSACPKDSAGKPTTNYFLGTAAGVPFGTSSGTATTFSQNGSFQLPRTYLYAVGMRF